MSEFNGKGVTRREVLIGAAGGLALAAVEPDPAGAQGSQGSQTPQQQPAPAADAWVVAANENVQISSNKTTAARASSTRLPAAKRDRKDSKDTKDTRDSKEIKDSKDSKESKEPKEPERKKFAHPWGPPKAPDWSGEADKP